jgi:hypothetical protein
MIKQQLAATTAILPTECESVRYRRLSRSWPETGLAEINDDLREADFWPASLKVVPGPNFRVARDPRVIA